jgi:hypothetical protein
MSTDVTIELRVFRCEDQQGVLYIFAVPVAAVQLFVLIKALFPPLNSETNEIFK